MITVVAKCLVKAGETENFKQYTAKLIAETRKEVGNISYALHEDINNKQILTFIEEWQDQKALDEHMATKHFTDIVPKLNALQEAKTEVNLYQKC